MSSALDQVNTIIGIITTVVGDISAISLLVGVISVMNIMLVSVTESMVLTILDGLIGLGFAALVVGTIGNAMDLKETVSLGVAMGRIGFSAGVGILPANKASKLDPFEALRYDQKRPLESLDFERLYDVQKRQRKIQKSCIFLLTSDSDNGILYKV